VEKFDILIGILSINNFLKKFNLQEDSPKSEIPSVVGVSPGSANGITEPEVKSDNNITSSKLKLQFTYLK